MDIMKALTLIAIWVVIIIAIAIVMGGIAAIAWLILPESRPYIRSGIAALGVKHKQQITN